MKKFDAALPDNKSMWLNITKESIKNLKKETQIEDKPNPKKLNATKNIVKTIPKQVTDNGVTGILKNKTVIEEKKKTAIPIVQNNQDTNKHSSKVIDSKNNPDALPNLGTILNSMQNTQKLYEIDQDFKKAEENENDFKFKPLNTFDPIMKKNLLVTNENHTGIKISDDTKMPIKILKALASKFSLVPVDDVEKDREHLSYCPQLGRKSVFCPNGNPLIY